MNYNKLQTLIDKKNVMRKSIAEKLKVSGQGWDNMMKNHTLTVKRLEMLSELLGVSPGYFFDDNENILQEPAQEYFKSLKSMSVNLQEDLKYFRERCNQLERDLSELRDKNKKAC